MSLIKTIARNTATLTLVLAASAVMTDPAAAWFGGGSSFDGIASSDTELKCADFDVDGEVGTRDLAALLGEFGKKSKPSASGTSYSRCSACEYDLNNDGVVDERDVDELIEQWGSNACATAQEAGICESDLDGDGSIGNRDLAIVLNDFGACPVSEADLNDDGVVDEEDRDLLLKHWGEIQCADSMVVSSTMPCRADFNEDGDIGAEDLAEVLYSYGDYSCPSDFDGDGEVGDEDVDILLERWGNDCEG